MINVENIEDPKDKKLVQKILEAKGDELIRYCWFNTRMDGDTDETLRARILNSLADVMAKSVDEIG